MLAPRPLAVLALVALVAGCAAPAPLNGGTLGTSTSDNLPPVARFTASAAEVLPGQVVAFDATASSDPDGQLRAYDWKFGDGATDAGSHGRAAHVYLFAGAYIVLLTVTDNSPSPQSATALLTVGVDDAQALRGAVSAAPLDGTGGPAAWSQTFSVQGAARILHLHLNLTADASAPDSGGARVGFRLLDPSGTEVWSDTRDVGPAGEAVDAVVGGNLIAAPGIWTLDATAPSGAAAFAGDLTVAYGSGATSARSR